ncbi:Hsp20/alpha crystallin family protein [Synechococcus sp. CBW1002]|jgi:HSP20 family protein|uniref:Hsp20/alpha crystallin family protein n=1 Tax=unclassified Synechococcus TaxID=2626047 RepID=UPI0018CD32C6|nr:MULTISPECIES: Hsp20/alpha crystallin family protein [unclassified Synechococcus]QPN60513.1 Hsp20/alpha crystallin family protein [Synechococcus sp. CBW1002]QPN67778.1 Hsp20/alpha crystallin family protein [Synechococcus sp. CBW1006]
MALLKRESLKDVEDLFDRYPLSLPWPFGRSGSSLSTMALSDWQPRVDISESASGYEVRADIPGVCKEDLRVTLQDGILTIQGERHQEKKEDSERLHRVERVYGSFSRSFHLPEDADATAMQAAAKDGQLTVTVPRRESAPSEEPVQIPVQ